MNTGEEPHRAGYALRAAVAMAMAVSMTVGLLPAAAVQADTEAGRPAAKNPDRTVTGKKIKVRPRKTDPATTGPARPEAAWPKPGAAKVEIPDATLRRAKVPSPARAGKLPVWIGRADRGGEPGTVAVRVLERAASARAGMDGLVFTLAPGGRAEDGRAGGMPARVRVRVDYSSFAEAFGGTYGARLRLVRLPSCAVTTPGRSECRTATQLRTRNDERSMTLTAEVGTADASGPVVLAAAAEPDSDKGDYRATSLSASATWNAGGNTGEFAWSYPMRVPPVPGELTPDIKLRYSSGTVDGRTSNTNNQPSWVGEGFDLWPGFIERRYKACEDDGAPKSNGIDPGDQCWAYDNATVTWNGKGGELIKAADGTWRLKNDDGTKFEKLTSASTGNGDDNGEYWKVTTTDGTRFYFGHNRLPGWSSGKPQTNSAWTMPVFGDDSGEPCHKSSGFDASWCRQAWRWNLDYVVDPNGNVITYHYAKETNHYGRNVTPSADTEYVRGGYLKSISYGLREDAVFAAAPARVKFAVSERCIGDGAYCDPSKIETEPFRWPDVPWDQHCAAGDECAKEGKIAPTFWSRKRLTGVTTQVREADSTYRDVNSWALTHEWGDADIDRALLLQSIQHTGKAAGTEVSLPKVTFAHTELVNRLDKTGDDIPPFIKYRVGTIYDEYGGTIDVNYSERQCSLGDLPAPESNTKRCFPVYWQPAGHDEPIRDWFHKYVVTQVIRSDRTARSPDMVTQYRYLGGGAWHFDDDDGLTKQKHKTWSQWRGYGHVRVKTGGWNDLKSQTDTYYLRGMDGDRAGPSGGKKNVEVPDGEGGTYEDHDALAGFVLKTVKYTEPGGSVHEKTVRTPWRVQTASRARSWGTTTANVVNADTTRTWTALDGGTWRQTKTDTDYATSGPGVGRVKNVNDLGDVSNVDDDKCTRTTYADNAGSHMVKFPAREETVSGACTAAVDRSTDVISDKRIRYDGGGFEAAPTRGNATKTEEIASHDGTAATYVTQEEITYDGYGRPLTVTDAAGHTTTTEYTDTAGLNTKVTTTGPPVTSGDPSSAHVTTETLDPAWGSPTAETDAGGKTTHIAYDALGRRTKVWLPTRRTSQDPNFEFAYHLTEGQIAAVTTKTLAPGGGQRASIKLYDGLLRPRQTQRPGPDGGRLITDSFHDSRGNLTLTYDTYYATGAPTTSLFGVADPGDVETQTDYLHDGLGRVTAKRFLVGNNDVQEKWRTTYGYGGNWKTVDPPAGGTPTAEFTDARGQVTERRSYKGGSPAGDYESTTYTYTPAGKRATITGPGGDVWRYDYDQRGRRTKTVDPDKGTSTSTYNDLDQVVSATDARGKTIVTGYDPLGRKVEVREGSATGSLRAEYVYDTRRKGQLTSATRYVDGHAYTSRIDYYDNMNRPIRQTVVIPGAEGPLAGSYTFGTSYNLDDTVRSTSFPAAGGLPAEAVVRTYDDLARPIELSGTSSYVTGTDYSHIGKPLQYELSTGGKRAWQTLTWEHGTRRPATSRVDREGIAGVDRNVSYRHDPAGNITSISDASRGGTDTQCYAYDHLRRLTEAWTQNTEDCAAAPSAAVLGGPAPFWHSYAYDAAGNRTEEVRHGVGGHPDTTRTYTMSAEGNKLTGVAQTGGDGARTDSFAYDAAGNMTTRTLGATTQTLQWDAAGDLAEITEGDEVTSFVYDADGERLLRKDSDGTTLYLPNMELRLDKGATTPSATRYYTHNDQTVALRTPAGVQFLIADHQGTAQLAIDAGSQALAQRRFTPFGAERGTPSGSWPDDKSFVGGTDDPGTGLLQLGARHYDPASGRFISVDPLIDPGDDQSLNGYAYAGNSPVTFNDATGLCRDVNPIMGPISCHAPGNDGKPHGIGGEPNPGGHVFRGSPSEWDGSRYHYWPKSRGGGRGGGGASAEPRPTVNKCDWKCKLKNKVGDLGSSTWNAIKNVNDSINWRTVLKRTATVTGLIAAGACILLTAGVCLVATAGAVAASGAWNAYRWRNGEISGTRAFVNTGVDAIAFRFRAVRAYRGPLTSTAGRNLHRYGPIRFTRRLPRNKPVTLSFTNTYRKYPGHVHSYGLIHLYYGHRSYNNGW